jgi:octaprenyl-diphosphate synthase
LKYSINGNFTYNFIIHMINDTHTETENIASNANELYGIIETEMAAVREGIEGELRSTEELINPLCSYISRYQGKMLRPAVLLLSGKACGPVGRKHVDYSVVMELVHLATLVHDDVLDEAKIRRKSATVSRLWGNEPSVLLGDYLLSKGFGVCARVGDLETIRELSQVAQTICQGELLQCLTREDWAMTEERYLEIIGMKTAIFYQVCCRLGAKESQGTTEEQSALEEYGRLIGNSFQITDDLLDIVGRENEAGKTLGTDISQCKPTLPIIHFCRLSDPGSYKYFLELIHDPKDTRPEILSLLDRSGSLEYSWGRAGEMAGRAREKLRTLKASAAREALDAIAEFVVKRTC